MLEAVVFVVAQAKLTLSLPGIVALIAGILILIWPDVLAYIVAIYLIVIGLIQVFDINI
jgi:hypothetical protein